MITIIIIIISSPNQNILHSVIGNLQKVIIIVNSMHMAANDKGKEKCYKVSFANLMQCDVNFYNLLNNTSTRTNPK